MHAWCYTGATSAHPPPKPEGDFDGWYVGPESRCGVTSRRAGRRPRPRRDSSRCLPSQPCQILGSEAAFAVSVLARTSSSRVIPSGASCGGGARLRRQVVLLVLGRPRCPSVCRPMRRLIGPGARACVIARAALAAPGADGNATKKASPCGSTSTPPLAAHASRTTRRCSASASAYASAASSRRSLVDPSTSVKRKVTVPVGRSDRTPCDHPQWRSRLAAHPPPREVFGEDAAKSSTPSVVFGWDE